jgi:glycine cleavage system H protein
MTTMAGYPSDLRYTEQHEWVRADGEYATLGITQWCADKLGAVGFVELPYAGELFKPGDVLTRMSSDTGKKTIRMPFLGQVNALNQKLTDTPGHVNSDPYGTGWIVRLEPGDRSDVDGLMDAEAYEAFVAAQAG